MVQSTFTSCGDDDDNDTIGRADTIYVINKDTVYVNNGGSNSTTPGAYAMGWIDLTIYDLDNNIVLHKKVGQELDSWDCACMEKNNVAIYIRGKGDWHLTKGSYAINTYSYVLENVTNENAFERGSMDFYIYDDTSLGYLYPLDNQRHNITKVEKIGQFIDGNYLYAIEGNFDIKMSKNGEGSESHTARCSYRLIAESDYFSENE